jgi:hypothetical protein
VLAVCSESYLHPLQRPQGLPHSMKPLPRISKSKALMDRESVDIRVTVTENFQSLPSSRSSHSGCSIYRPLAPRSQALASRSVTTHVSYPLLRSQPYDVEVSVLLNSDGAVHLASSTNQATTGRINSRIRGTSGSTSKGRSYKKWRTNAGQVLSSRGGYKSRRSTANKSLNHLDEADNSTKSPGILHVNDGSQNIRSREWAQMVSSFDPDVGTIECDIVVYNNLSIHDNDVAEAEGASIPGVKSVGPISRGVPIVFCWVNEHGKLFHYRKIQPLPGKNRHKESGTTNHAFVGFRGQLGVNAIRADDVLPEYIQDIRDEDFIFAFKPTLGEHKHELTVAPARKTVGGNNVHVYDVEDSYVHCDYTVTRFVSDEKVEMIDCTELAYLREEVEGFCVFYEDGVFDEYPALYEALQEDFAMLCALLPPAAIKKLRTTTPLWINKALVYGPKSR